jgi:carbonic anhydrase
MMNKWLVLLLLWTPLFAAENDLQKLLDGNYRYVKGRKGPQPVSQKPFATIIACADSRVPPEIIFDQGQGDLFVVRVAGNVVGELEMESINYSVDQLGVELIMVLGHENCGAVEAVRKHQTYDIPAITTLIEPSIEGTKSLESAIKANVKGVVNYLRKFLNVKVVGGYYDFGTGKVEILSNS